jgi:hypothetical protein
MTGLAHDLATRLPLTRQALHDGIIDACKAQVIAEATRCLDAAAAAAAEAAIVPDRVTGKTPGQIRAEIARAVLKADPAAARQRREQAQKDARVELWREDAGTAAIVSFGLPPDEALAADQQITSRALDLKAAGVPGSMDALRVRAYLDALLGQDTAARYRTTPSQPASNSSGSSTPGGDSHSRTNTAGNGSSDSAPAGTRSVNVDRGHGPGDRDGSPAGADPQYDAGSHRDPGPHSGHGPDPGEPGPGEGGARGRGPHGEPGAPAGNQTPGGSAAPGPPGGTGRENQPDHSPGHPARPGRAPRRGDRIRAHRRRPGPHPGRPGRRPPRHHLVPHRH